VAGMDSARFGGAARNLGATPAGGITGAPGRDTLRGRSGMTAPHEMERCPQCRQDGYTYDPVCHIWCCGRCHATETVEERIRREGRQGELSAARRTALRAGPAHKAGRREHSLPLRARRVS